MKDKKIQGYKIQTLQALQVCRVNLQGKQIPNTKTEGDTPTCRLQKEY